MTKDQKDQQIIRLLSKIFTSVDISEILNLTKQLIKADDIRFRVVDWRESAVVLPSAEPIRTTSKEEILEPELARREFRDRIDCVVGKVCADFEAGKKESESSFRFPELANQEELKTFRTRINQLIIEAKAQQIAWEIYYRELMGWHDLEDKVFYRTAMRKLPLQKFQDRKKQKKNWINFWYYLEKEEGKRGKKRIDAFIKEVEKTSKWYEDTFDKWSKYTGTLNNYSCEIAIPVAAGNVLLGVVNAHKVKGDFDIDDVEILKLMSVALAKAELHSQQTSMHNIQKVEQAMSDKWRFEDLSSQVSRGIRNGIIGLSASQIFPLLYIPDRLIDKDDHIEDYFKHVKWRFVPRNKSEYKDRIWDKEQKLGEIEIRDDGLGYTSIMGWQKAALENKMEANRYFVVCGDTDNPNSKDGGSPSARRKGKIKTTGCLPLAFEGKVYGLLYLHFTKRHYFTRDELTALELFGGQVAVAIKNAELLSPIKPYEDLYGSSLLDLFKSMELETNNKFNSICKRLQRWASEVRGTRGSAISECIERTIKDLSENHFLLPRNFLEDFEKEKQVEAAFHPIEGYRDHFIHPFHVFCLGLYLLYRWNKENIYPLDLGNRMQCYGYSEARLWFATALRHDLGYPAEKFELLVENFFKSNVGRGIHSQFDWGPALLTRGFVESIDRLVQLFKSKYPKAEADFRWWLYKRVLEDHDHGVLSALMLLSRLDQDFVLDAALAIALHSYRGGALQSNGDSKSIDDDNQELGVLEVHRFPLAFFLVYCDTSQEWGRRILLEYLIKQKAPHNLRTSSETVLEGIETTSEKTIINDQEFETNMTKIILKHRVSRKTNLTKDMNIVDLVNDIADSFEDTWRLSEGDKYCFSICSKDSEGHEIRGYGPKHPEQ